MMLVKRAIGDCVAMPWKNGGGETRQIAIWPPDATLDSFDWRISSARVGSTGAFSRFEGIDRSLAVLRGGSLRLSWNDETAGTTATHMLVAGTPPFRFRGETAIDCDIGDAAAVFDLNVMTRRNRFTHHMEKLDLTESTTVRGRCLVFYCLAPALRCTVDGEPMPVRLLEDEVLIVDAAAPTIVALQSEVGARVAVWCMHIFEAHSPQAHL